MQKLNSRISAVSGNSRIGATTLDNSRIDPTILGNSRIDAIKLGNSRVDATKLDNSRVGTIILCFDEKIEEHATPIDVLETGLFFILATGHVCATLLLKLEAKYVS